MATTDDKKNLSAPFAPEVLADLWFPAVEAENVDFEAIRDSLEVPDTETPDDNVSKLASKAVTEPVASANGPPGSDAKAKEGAAPVNCRLREATWRRRAAQ